MNEDNEQTRLYQMDNQTLEYRVTQLENERLPRRVAEVEFIAAQLQGEVTAVKEIARGIGVKLDSGIERLTTNSQIEMTKMQTEQAKSMAFIKGIMWLLGGMVGFAGFVVMVSPVIKKMLGE